MRKRKVDSWEIENDDMGTLCICAIRYCQGRETYMPDLVREIIRPHLQRLNTRTLAVLLNDCDFQERMNLYGSETIDKPGWIQWKHELEAERDRRNGEE